MSHHSADLIDRLANSEETGLDAGLFVPLVRLLVDGEPVTVEQLAEAAGRSVDDVRAGLAAVPDTEYDDHGRIVGQVLTLRPTVHRFTVAGEELYAWCALDTLFLPALLDRPARIESASPASGEPIRITVDPTTGVTNVEPTTAVVSLVNPEQMALVRSAFCHPVQYFTSPEDAASWLGEHPDAEIVSVADAYQLGAAVTARRLDQLNDNPAAARDCPCD